MTGNGRRLIEDYLPIEAISAESSREKSIRKGHISTLHLWWARRPLVACRAAVYAALVPMPRIVPAAAGHDSRESLARDIAAKFVKRLCRYPTEGRPDEAADIARAVKEAQQHILDAHAQRLTDETGTAVRVQDIVAGNAPRPKVLDMFAGGGAIPLEALRLGCEAYAVDLNPIAHIIELSTLVYPQRFGTADLTARGITGPKDVTGHATWGGLVGEVEHWADWVLSRLESEIGESFPLITDPEYQGTKQELQADWFRHHGGNKEVPGYLVPVAYLWTRTVVCRNPTCRGTIPLAKLNWVRRERKDAEGRYVAVRRRVNSKARRIEFHIVEGSNRADIEQEIEGTTAGNVACPFCGSANDDEHVKREGVAGRIGYQLIAIAARRPGQDGKHYVAGDDVEQKYIPAPEDIERKLTALCKKSGLTVPDEPVVADGKQSIWIDLYGLVDFGKVFTRRQLTVGLALAAIVRDLSRQLASEGIETERVRAISVAIALGVDRHLNQNNTLGIFNAQGETLEGALNDKTLPMAWDFPEANPLSGVTGSVQNAFEWVVDVLKELSGTNWAGSAQVIRGSATDKRFPDNTFDAVITDPPYYDNVSYAVLSDFFYAWLKRMLGELFREHFAAPSTPKKKEAVMDSERHGGDADAAKRAYQEMIEVALRNAQAALKPDGILACVYAHKTTLGWATLVDSMRRAGFAISEAWPIETERKGGKKTGKAVLASSIFLIARKRKGHQTGRYEDVVKPGLDMIVRERVSALWAAGISGADLVIACVGAGLRAFTQYERVEYANGEEVPAERFLAEVETVVLESILDRLANEVGGNGTQYSLASLDPAGRFYLLWRYTYGSSSLDAGEAIIFANGTHVELDGPSGLTNGARPLIEKKRDKYRLLSYAERGDDDRLGLPSDEGESASIIDVLHRLLWIMENKPGGLADFMSRAQVNTDQLRLVAQALAGPALKGGEMTEVSPTGEHASLAKLMANWRGVIEHDIDRPTSADQRKGQYRLELGKRDRGSQ